MKEAVWEQRGEPMRQNKRVHGSRSASHVQRQLREFHHSTTRKRNPSLLYGVVNTLVTQLKVARGPARPGPAGLPATKVSGSVCSDSYPRFLGSPSRGEPPPFSFRTSFSLLRRMDARSLLKEPLLFREPEPS